LKRAIAITEQDGDGAGGRSDVVIGHDQILLGIAVILLGFDMLERCALGYGTD
jgi:hypothetical protein